MDLRKKASPLQRFGELLLRFRLIFILIFAILYGVFARDFSAIFSYGFSAVESVLKQFTAVPQTFSIVKENAVPIFFFFSGIFLLCFLFVRVAIFKAFLPALLTGYFWTAISQQGQFPAEEYLAFLAVNGLGILAFAIIVGVFLGKGSPVAGATVGSLTKVFFPILILHILLGGLGGYFFQSTDLVLRILFPLISLALFFFVEFPFFTFAPMGKMRAAQRTMKLN